MNFLPTIVSQHNDYYVLHIFRDTFSGQNSTFNHFIERTKDDRDTCTEVPSLEIIQNATDNYKNLVASK